MITLLGATGYTGRLTAAALDRAGLPFRLAGRSEQKLSGLSQSLATKPEYNVIDIGHTHLTPDLFAGTDLLINCAGPFTNLGEVIFRQAALQGIHYLDPGNELGYLYRLQTYRKLAEQTEAIMAPACGFEVALADCAVRLLLHEHPGPVQDVHVVYDIRHIPSSPGTRRSIQRALATSWMAWKDGHWAGQPPGARIGRFTFGDKRIRGLSIPGGEHAVIPLHVPVSTVGAWLSVNPWQAALAPLVASSYARFLRSIAGPWLQKMVSGHIPDEETNPKGYPFEIYVATRVTSNKLMAMRVSGRNPYSLTARILTAAARAILNGHGGSPGIVPPSQLLGTDCFQGLGVSGGPVEAVLPE